MSSPIKKPKIVHYCWFGGKDFPPLEQQCISSWQEQLPDYEFILWNEQNFDIHASKFCSQAYEKKMFAFVSDYARAWVLVNHGGTYFDTDVGIYSNIGRLLEENENVLGFETRHFVGTAVMSFVPRHGLMKEMLESYSGDFVDSSGVMRLETNVTILRRLLEKRGLVQNGSEQMVEDIRIFPRDYFFPQKRDGIFATTENTVAIHYGTGSWLTERQKNRGNNIIWINFCRPVLRGVKNIIHLLFGDRITEKIEMKIRNLLR